MHNSSSVLQVEGVAPRENLPFSQKLSFTPADDEVLADFNPSQEAPVTFKAKEINVCARSQEKEVSYAERVPSTGSASDCELLQADIAARDSGSDHTVSADDAETPTSVGTKAEDTVCVDKEADTKAEPPTLLQGGKENSSGGPQSKAPAASKAASGKTSIAARGKVTHTAHRSVRSSLKEVN